MVHSRKTYSSQPWQQQNNVYNVALFPFDYRILSVISTWRWETPFPEALFPFDYNFISDFNVTMGNAVPRSSLSIWLCFYQWFQRDDGKYAVSRSSLSIWLRFYQWFQRDDGKRRSQKLYFPFDYVFISDFNVTYGKCRSQKFYIPFDYVFISDFNVTDGKQRSQKISFHLTVFLSVISTWWWETPFPEALFPFDYVFISDFNVTMGNAVPRWLCSISDFNVTMENAFTSDSLATSHLRWEPCIFRYLLPMESMSLYQKWYYQQFDDGFNSLFKMAIIP